MHAACVAPKYPAPTTDNRMRTAPYRKFKYAFDGVGPRCP